LTFILKTIGPGGHIAHLSHIGQFFPCAHQQGNFPYSCPTLSLGVMTILYETHFCTSKGNFYVNSNSSGAADLRDFLIILHCTLKHTFKNGFPLCGPKCPLPTHDFKILILQYLKKLLCKFELLWLNSYSKEDFKYFSH
jgi:hypothetical protein